MNPSSHKSGPDSAAVNPARSASFPMAVLTSLFFMWGFITSLNDILIPHLKNVFALNYTQAMLIQFCFFGAYFVVSIPAGNLVARIGYKRGLMAGLILAGVGCLMFLPAANLRVYPLFLAALFVLASGVTLLQVSANPAVTSLGPVATASSRLTLTQAFNSLGTTLAPLFGAWLILSSVPHLMPAETLTPAEMTEFRLAEAASVQLPYILLAVTLFALAFILAWLRLPEPHRAESEPNTVAETTFSIWQYPHLLLGAVGIFAYVGAEVAIGSLMISYITEVGQRGMSEQTAAQYVAWYWGGAMVGRFIGAWVMTRVKPGTVLGFNATAAALLVLFAIVDNGHWGTYALLLVGLCNSIMFPTIFSLGLAHLGPLTGKGSGLLCCAIVGGALVPLMQGVLADSLGLQLSFLLPVLCYVYIVFYGLRGFRFIKPLSP